MSLDCFSANRKQAFKFNKTYLKYKAFVSLRKPFLPPIACFCFMFFPVMDAEVFLKHWGGQQALWSYRDSEEQRSSAGTHARGAFPFPDIYHNFRMSLMGSLFYLGFLDTSTSSRKGITERDAKDQKSLHERQSLKKVIWLVKQWQMKNLILIL